MHFSMHFNPTRSAQAADTLMTPSRPAARTMAGQAELYNAVKAMAVSFEFKPGERINEVELARRLNVSRTPLREVLNQLMV